VDVAGVGLGAGGMGEADDCGECEDVHVFSHGVKVALFVSMLNG
jgi:hypothetical protein